MDSFSITKFSRNISKKDSSRMPEYYQPALLIFYIQEIYIIQIFLCFGIAEQMQCLYIQCE